MASPTTLKFIVDSCTYAWLVENDLLDFLFHTVLVFDDGNWGDGSGEACHVCRIRKLVAGKNVLPCT